MKDLKINNSDPLTVEHESTTDREEIEDVTGEFDALLLELDISGIKLEVDIVINAETLSWPEPSWLVVFRRKEEIKEPST